MLWANRGMLTPGLAPYGGVIATTELLLNLYLLIPGGWQVYLWHDETGVTLIDTGAAGSGPGPP